ncbi:hypothetical protein L6452_02645 [Arctium lappa]|uniref:Uncharacterized protein n=1 Tax=Arctium lappa TaxID=4217 RepID=A0ACB9FK15_ARCLA|nr:hypothetical protein L6452_02645 [Arctium lappa]
MKNLERELEGNWIGSYHVRVNISKERSREYKFSKKEEVLKLIQATQQVTTPANIVLSVGMKKRMNNTLIAEVTNLSLLRNLFSFSEVEGCPKFMVEERILFLDIHGIPPHARHPKVRVVEDVVETMRLGTMNPVKEDNFVECSDDSNEDEWRIWDSLKLNYQDKSWMDKSSYHVPESRSPEVTGASEHQSESEKAISPKEGFADVDKDNEGTCRLKDPFLRSGKNNHDALSQGIDSHKQYKSFNNEREAYGLNNWVDKTMGLVMEPKGGNNGPFGSI